MKKKVVICLFASANKGKTSSIRKVFEMLGGNEEVLQKGYEISDITMRGDVRIGCESEGDPNSAQTECIEDLMKNKQCNIIVTASRTYGSTVDNVIRLSKEYGYDIEWISPLYGDDEARKLLFDFYAEKNAEIIINLIDKYIGGEL